jgi:hypothetical protein
MAKNSNNGHGDRQDHRGHSGHVTETPDVSHIKNIDVTHEASDVSVNALLKFVLALTVMTGLVAVLMLGLFKFFQLQAEKEPPPGPMSMTKEERLPPEPRLQGAEGFQIKLENGQVVNLELREPEAEYRVLREQWERELNCKYEEAPVVHDGERQASITRIEAPQCMPIDEAIQRVVKDQSLRSRVKEIPEEGPGWRAIDYGIDIPTAASSGRTTMKGK